MTGNTKESLTLFPSELLYMEPTGNYVQIHYQMNGQVLQKVIWTILLQMKEFLSDYPFLVRCHRAFIVNMFRIEKIKRFKFLLKSVETEISLSKVCKTNIQKQME